jgi:ankyrin repeat protein
VIITLCKNRWSLLIGVLIIQMLLSSLVSAQGGLTNDWARAIKANDIEFLRSILLHKGAENRATAEGKTILMAAAAAGDARLVRQLLQFGANVNQSNHRGGSALMYAAARGNYNVVTMLADAGAEINQRADNGWTAIQLAAAKGYGAIVRQLLDFQADVNAQDIFGYSALMRAVVNGKLESIAVLLSTDAIDLSINNSRGETVIQLALMSDDCVVTRMLWGVAQNSQELLHWAQLRRSVQSDCPF